MTEYVIQVDENDLAVIAAGLAELPMKVAKGTFDKINAQLIAAQPPAEPPPEVPTN